MNTLMQSAVRGLVAAGLLAFGSAQAQMIDFGTDPDSVAVSRTFVGDGIGNTSFSAEGMFTITQSSAVASFAFSQWSVIAEGLRALTLTLLQDDTVILQTSASTVVPPSGDIKAFTFQSFNEVLAAGSYTVTLSGTVRPGGGSFLWGLDANPAAPIPEPSEWLMIGAGLGLVGFAARRQRKQVG